MENISHSLVGGTLAELALPAGARVATRRLFFAAGIVAANLPDADLLYTRITPPPLGYLLHHRGHTHTLVGCAILGVCVWLLTLAFPPVRRLVSEHPRRFWSLIAVALLSHIVLDSWNSYGVHPFWPIDNRWYYGDAIYILEPWLWVSLGAAIAANARSTVRRIVLTLCLIAPPILLVTFGMIPIGALIAIAAIGGGFWLAVRRVEPRARSAAAVSVVVAFVAAMFGLSHLARGLSIASLRLLQQGEVLDVILNPRLASPLCWSALSIEKNELAGEYVLRRGSISLFSSWLPVTMCDTSRAAASAIGASRSRVVWSPSVHQSLSRLRDVTRADCRVRAWMQFGRAPAIDAGFISDLRFGGEGSGNFTSMRLSAPATSRLCPPHLTNWNMPRADLLSVRTERP